MRCRALLDMLTLGIVLVVISSSQAQDPKPIAVDEIAQSMAPGAYSPTPTIADRDFWALVGKSQQYKSVIEDAEKLLGTSIQPLPDDLYLDFSKTGNRSRYERVYFNKLRVFRTLVVAECVENKGRFIKPIQDLIVSYAGDKSWVLPAHDGGLENFEGRQITIDLFASEVACELATADRLLGDRLDQATRALVRQEVQRRIFDPYKRMVTEGKPRMWWLTTTNNWNAVCLANVTGAALALLDGPTDKAFYVGAAEQYITYFLSGFTDDGYCSEGIGYWNYGFGCFVRLGHMLSGATGGAVDLFALPKARSAGLFARRMEVTPGVYPAFADCAVGATPSREIMSYISRRYELPPTPWEQQGFSSVRWLDEFGVFDFVFREPGATQAAELPAKSDWFEDAGILICRGAQTKGGLPIGVALKGGHNAEHHNHNDLGSYIYCIGSSMTLVDPGAEVYTRRTFSSERYVSNVLNSFGHPVPRVDGKLQRTGREAQAEVLKCELADDRDVLALDLTSGYPVTSLKQLTRTFVFERGAGGVLTISDEIQCESPVSFGTAVITFDAWQQVGNDRLLVGKGDTAVEITIDAGGLPFKIEPTTIEEDVRGNEKPVRIGIDLAEPVDQAVLRLTARPAR